MERSLDQVTIGSLRDEIDEMEDKEPSDKRTLRYREWREQINALFTSYNNKIGWKAYKLIQ